MKEKNFFTKSEKKFNTEIISAWWMLTKHLKALKKLSAKDMPSKKYKSLWDYENYLIRSIAQLEKIPCLQFLLEDDNPTHLEILCKQEPYKGPWKTRDLKIITVGDFGLQLQSFSSSSGEQ